MANIVYNITIDANGNAAVVQDIQELTTADNVTFTSNRDDTAIKFTDGSLFNKPGLKTGDVVKVGKQLGPLPVENTRHVANPRIVPGFGKRRTYHFECGSTPDGVAFVRWGGGGGDPTGGGQFP